MVINFSEEGLHDSKNWNQNSLSSRKRSILEDITLFQITVPD